MEREYSFTKMQKTKFKPLTYIECIQDKPLNIKLDEEHFFETNLQIASNFINFNTNKNIVMGRLEELNKLKETNDAIDAMKVECYSALIDLLYDISKPEKEDEQKIYFKYLHKLFMSNLGLMTDVFTKVLEYNSRLKKKLENLRTLEVFPKSVSDTTAGGVSLSELIREDPKTGEKYFVH
jgi:hypothetical protein